MAKIRFEHRDKSWELEFDRKSFVNAEKSGFHLEGIIHTPLLQMETLFRIALLKNHPSTSEKVLQELLDVFVEKYGIDDFLNFAVEEYRHFMPTTQPSSTREKMNIIND